MEIASSRLTSGQKSSAPSTPSKAVNFRDTEITEKQREKFLTAKYGAHQMALIRKRLKVEMWMYDQLQKLYTDQNDVAMENYIEIDLDEVLDMEEVTQRKKFLINVLKESPASKESKQIFIEDLLERANTL